MKKTFIVLAGASLLMACKPNPKTSAVRTSDSTQCFNTDSVHFCTNKSNGFCPDLPPDVWLITSPDGKFSNGYSSVLSPDFQPSFDIFSWQTFIALNWPASSTGKPIGEIQQYPDSLRVWEYYTDVSDVFPKADKLLHQNLMSAKKEGKKFFYMTAKSPDPLPTDEHADLLKTTGFKEADGHPLIDRNLNFAVFEEKINPIEHDFIIKNNLISLQGIDSFYNANNQQFNLPINKGNLPGAMEIKASWRIVDTAYGDDLSRYYTQPAIIYIGAENSVDGKPFSIECTVGLVGLHIIRKTSRFTNWVWSTFEHIDNTPDSQQQAQNEQNRQWSFYNPHCLNCLPNQPPAYQQGDTIGKEQVYRFNSTPPYASRYGTTVPGEAKGDTFGTQVTRLFPIYYCTEAMNELWQGKLKSAGSVWANYRLIGTQWMTVQDAPPFAKIDAPFFLANSTSETYEQETSTCIGCHGDYAGVTYNGTTIKTDFSFIFDKAQDKNSKNQLPKR